MAVPGWQEVSRDVFVRRYQPLGVNVCLVRGREGLLLVDTGSSGEQAATIERDITEITDEPVRWVVNTHAHYDHTFGNEHFAHVPIFGHHRLPTHLRAHERHEPCAARVVITPPTRLVAEASLVDLGGREVALIPLPPAHTDTDLVVRIPATRTWIVGDIVEQSGPPVYGPDSAPLCWPTVLRELLDQVGPADVVVPGHGRPVGRQFVADQLMTLLSVATEARRLHEAGATAEQALEHGHWPDVAGLADAVTVAFATLDGGDARVG